MEGKPSLSGSSAGPRHTCPARQPRWESFNLCCLEMLCLDLPMCQDQLHPMPQLQGRASGSEAARIWLSSKGWVRQSEGHEKSTLVSPQGHKAVLVLTGEFSKTGFIFWALALDLSSSKPPRPPAWNPPLTHTLLF